MNFSWFFTGFSLRLNASGAFGSGAAFPLHSQFRLQRPQRTGTGTDWLRGFLRRGCLGVAPMAHRTRRGAARSGNGPIPPH
jgi:hypothetical protein